MKVVHVTQGNLYGYFLLGFVPYRNSRKGKLVMNNPYTGEKVISENTLKLEVAKKIEQEWEDSAHEG